MESFGSSEFLGTPLVADAAGLLSLFDGRGGASFDARRIARRWSRGCVALPLVCPEPDVAERSLLRCLVVTLHRGRVLSGVSSVDPLLPPVSSPLFPPSR